MATTLVLPSPAEPWSAAVDAAGAVFLSKAVFVAAFPQAGAVALGVGLPIAGWLQLHKRLAPSGTSLIGDLGAAFIFALLQPMFNVVVRQVLAKLFGVLQAPRETRLVVAVVEGIGFWPIGSFCVGMAFVVLYQVTDAHPSPAGEFLACCVGFFVFSLAQSWVGMAFLDKGYQLERLQVAWKEMGREILRGLRADFTEPRMVLPDCASKLCAFALFPTIDVAWSKFWLQHAASQLWAGTLLRFLWLFGIFRVFVLLFTAAVRRGLPDSAEGSHTSDEESQFEMVTC